jgi:hypothetical protein
MIVGDRAQGAPGGRLLEEQREHGDEDGGDQRGGEVFLVDENSAGKSLLEEKDRLLRQADVDLVDVIAEEGLARAFEEVVDAERGHQQRDALLVDELAQHQSLHRPGHRHHHQRGAGEREHVVDELVVEPREVRQPLGEPRHRQRGEEDHRALREIEDARGLEDQDEAERDQRIEHADHQAAEQRFEERSHQCTVPR